MDFKSGAIMVGRAVGRSLYSVTVKPLLWLGRSAKQLWNKCFKGKIQEHMPASRSSEGRASLSKRRVSIGIGESAERRGSIDVDGRLDKVLVASAGSIAEEGNSRLHVAAKSGKVEDVELLLGKQKGLATAVNYEGKTPLHLAAANGHLGVVKLLVDPKNVCDLNARDDTLDTPLHMAASAGDAESLSVLIDAGAEVESRNILLETPLHMAVRGGNVDCLNAFILKEKCEALNSMDSDGCSPLHWAIVGGDPKAISPSSGDELPDLDDLDDLNLDEFLGKEGLLLSDESPPKGANPNVQMVDILLDAGAKVDQRAINWAKGLLGEGDNLVVRLQEAFLPAKQGNE